MKLTRIIELESVNQRTGIKMDNQYNTVDIYK